MGLDREQKVFLGSLFFLFLLFVGVWSYLPVQDPPEYFDFADKRSLLGIPHFFDVSSNLFFAIVGIYGLVIFFRMDAEVDKGYRSSFFLLNLGVFFTAIGSSYFHLQPTPDRLFWDRLPMAIGFASLLALFIRDHSIVRSKHFYALLFVLNVLSVVAVANIHQGLSDLRPYIVVQYGFLLLMAILLFFIRRGRFSLQYLFLAFIFYIIAKVLEGLDRPIFDAVGISGHTLKHITAATGILYLNQAAYRLFVSTSPS